jgi:hypothetical protein
MRVANPEPSDLDLEPQPQPHESLAEPPEPSYEDPAYEATEFTSPNAPHDTYTDEQWQQIVDANPPTPKEKRKGWTAGLLSGIGISKVTWRKPKLIVEPYYGEGPIEAELEPEPVPKPKPPKQPKIKKRRNWRRILLTFLAALCVLMLAAVLALQIIILSKAYDLARQIDSSVSQVGGAANAFPFGPLPSPAPAVSPSPAPTSATPSPVPRPTAIRSTPAPDSRTIPSLIPGQFYTPAEAAYLHAMHDAQVGYLITHPGADFTSMTPRAYQAAWTTAIADYRVAHHLPPIPASVDITLPPQHTQKGPQ